MEDGEESEKAAKPAQPKSIDLSGENLFVHNLKKSKLFSNEELMTAIKERSNNEILRNGYDFTVQVKFNAELEAYPWSFDGEVGKKDGAMGGGSSRSSMRGDEM